MTLSAIDQLNFGLHQFQGSTLTFQLTSQVAGDILDVMTISVCLQAKLASGNQKPLAKLNFYWSVASWLPLVSSPEFLASQ